MTTLLTRQEAEALEHPKGTRTVLRQNFPQSKGNFSASIARELAVRILCGETNCDDAIQEWVAEQSKEVQHPDEGEHGAKEAVTVSSPEDDAVAMAIKIMAVTNPQGVEHLQRMAERSKRKAAMVQGPPEVVHTGSKVKVMGIDAPFVLNIGDPGFEHVPAPDAGAGTHYRMGSWRASQTVLGKRFEQDASDLLKMLLADERITLVGPPGTGKTSIIKELARHMSWPVTRFNGRKDVCVDDFVGSKAAGNGSTFWEAGPLEIAMVNGHILIVDEYDHMPSDCTSVLHPVLEPGGVLIITGDGGRVVRPHPNFRIILTSNTLGFGDSSGLHPAAAVQDYAMLTRSTVVFNVEYMNPKDESAILHNLYGVEPEMCDKMVALATDSRRAVAEQTMMYPIVPRQTMAWARFVARGFDLGNSLVMSILNKMPVSQHAPLFELVQRHFGKI